MKIRNKTTKFMIVIIVLGLILAGCGGKEKPEEPIENPKEVEDKAEDKDEIEEIEEEESEEVEEVVEVEDAFPEAEFEAIDEGTFNAAKEDVRTLESIEEAKEGENLLGYKILIVPNGYGGPMEIFTYIDLEGKVLKVEIGEHEETEGIGSQTKDPKFLNKFSGISSSDELGSIDGVAGATFSSGGVKDGIKRALSVFDTHLK